MKMHHKYIYYTKISKTALAKKIRLRIQLSTYVGGNEILQFVQNSLRFFFEFQWNQIGPIWSTNTTMIQHFQVVNCFFFRFYWLTFVLAFVYVTNFIGNVIRFTWALQRSEAQLSFTLRAHHNRINMTQSQYNALKNKM